MLDDVVEFCLLVAIYLILSWWITVFLVHCLPITCALNYSCISRSTEPKYVITTSTSLLRYFGFLDCLVNFLSLNLALPGLLDLGLLCLVG